MVGYKVSTKKKKKLKTWSIVIIAQNYSNRLAFTRGNVLTLSTLPVMSATSKSVACVLAITESLHGALMLSKSFFSYNFSEESRACLEIVYSLPSCSQYVGSRVSESQFNWNLAFDSRARISGERWTSHSPLAFVSGFLKMYFFYSNLGRAHYFHSLGQDQSTAAHRTETTVAESCLTSCMSPHLLIGSHAMPSQRNSQSTPTSLFRCNLPNELLVE